MFKLIYTAICLTSLAQSVPLLESPGLGLSQTLGSGRPQLNGPRRREASISTGVELKLNGTASPAFNRSPLTSGHPQGFWYEQITHDGISPFIPGGEKWKVFRNAVAEYSADKSGGTDAQPALQKAINGRRICLPKYSDILLTVEQMDLGTRTNSVQQVSQRLYIYPKVSCLFPALMPPLVATYERCHMSR